MLNCVSRTLEGSPRYRSGSCAICTGPASKYILLHDWEGNTGELSVRGWQYWPERSEGQYRSRELNIPPYCPTQRSAVIDLLYDLHIVLLVVYAQGSSL